MTQHDALDGLREVLAELEAMTASPEISRIKTRVLAEILKAEDRRGTADEEIRVYYVQDWRDNSAANKEASELDKAYQSGYERGLEEGRSARAE